MSANAPTFDAARVEQSLARAVFFELTEEAHKASQAGDRDKAIAFFDRAADVYFARLKARHHLPCFLRPQAYV